MAEDTTSAVENTEGSSDGVAEPQPVGNGAQFVYEDRTSLDPSALNEFITATGPDDIARHEERMGYALKDGRPVVDLPHYARGDAAPLPTRGEPSQTEQLVNSQLEAGGAVPSSPPVVGGEAQGVAGVDEGQSGEQVSPPPQSANKPDHVDYAVEQGGLDRAEAESMTKEQLIEHNAEAAQ
jgi:hypothetical protein